MLADRLKLRFYEYYGDVSSIEPQSWTIGGTRFTTLAGTHIDPALKVGDQVLVLVYAGDDGTLYAQAILRLPEELIQQESFVPFEVEFIGSVDAATSESLVVGGKTIRITDQTEMKGDITTGVLVKIHALVAADGTLTAREIELTGSDVQPAGDDDSDDQGSEDDGDDSSQDDSEDDSDDSDSGDDDTSDNNSGDDGDDTSDDRDDSDSGGDSSDDGRDDDNANDSSGDQDDKSDDDSDDKDDKSGGDDSND